MSSEEDKPTKFSPEDEEWLKTVRELIQMEKVNEDLDRAYVADPYIYQSILDGSATPDSLRDVPGWSSDLDEEDDEDD